MFTPPSSPRPRGIAGLSAAGSSVKPEESSNQSGAGKRNFYSQPLPAQASLGDFSTPSPIQTFQSITAPLDPRQVIQVSINAMLDEWEEKENRKRAAQVPTSPESPDHQRVQGIPSDAAYPEQG